MPNLLITGANGFLGFHTTNALIKAGYNIFAPVRNNDKNKDSIFALKKLNVNVYEGNFFDENLLEAIFKNKISSIVHLAAIRGQTKENSDIYNKINVEGTKILLKFAQENGSSNFLYCSTVGVLGTIPANQPADRNHAAQPDNIYHKSKWEAEKLVKNAHSDSLKTLTLRPTITYGDGDNGFLPKLISLIVRRKFINSTKPVSIHLLDVKSFTNLVISVLENDYFDGQSYIIADKDPVKLSDLVNLIFRIKTCKAYPVYLGMPSLIFRFAALMSKLIGESGLETSIKLISRDWIYDIADTQSNLNYKPASTLESIEPIIKDYLNASK